MIKKYVLLVLSVAIATSCATISNKNYTKVRIKSNEPLNYVFNGDTVLNKLSDPLVFTVPRQRDPFPLTVFNEKNEKRLFIQSKRDSKYWLNFTSPYFLGFLIDELGTKKYTYPKKVYVDIAAPGNTYLPYYPFHKEYLERKNKISFTPLNLVQPYHPAVEISYERLHENNFATQITYGRLLSYDNDFARNSRGSKLMLEEKYFYRSQEKIRFYLSFVFECLWKTHEIVTYTESSPQQFTPETTTIQKHFYSAIPHIGFEKYISPRLVFDGYYGIGIRYRNVKYIDHQNNMPIDEDGWEWFNVTAESNRETQNMSSNWDLNFRLSWVF